MEKKTRRRVVSASLIVVLLLLGFGVWTILGTTTTVMLNLDGGAIVHSQVEQQFSEGRFRHSVQVNPRRPINPVNLVPIKPGYVFMGWQPAFRAGDHLETIPSTAGTIHAHWEREHYIARMHVNGIHAFDIDIVGGVPLAELAVTGAVNNWLVQNTPYYFFRGWEFYDLVGGRATLTPHLGSWRLDHFTLVNDEWLIDLDDDRNIDFISEETPFRPEIYDLTFNAILELRPAIRVFYHSSGLQTTDAEEVFDSSTNLFRPKTLLEPLSGTPSNFIGWRIEVPGVNSLVELNSEGGIQSIPSRLGHENDVYGARRDKTRLDQFLATIFAPHELLPIDPLLYYLTGAPEAVGSAISQAARVLHLHAVFHGDPNDEEVASRFYLRLINDEGNVSQRPITTMTPGDVDFISAQYAYLQGNQIFFLQPAARHGWVFSHFKYYDTIGNIFEFQPGPIAQSALPTIRGTMFIMVWERAPENVKIDFEYSWTRVSNSQGGSNAVPLVDTLHLINMLDFEVPGTFFQELVSNYFELESQTVAIGSTITLPSLAMFVGPNLTFSHWENQDGEIIGRAGDQYTVTTAESFRAIWVDNHVSFVFDLNGGRDFAPNLSLMRGRLNTRVNIPSAEPVRFGYDFLGWDARGTTYDAGEEIVVANHRTVLSAIWNPIDVTIELEYVYVPHGTTTINSQSMSVTVPFDSSIFLQRVPQSSAFNNHATLIGWRFPNRLSPIGAAASLSRISAFSNNDSVLDFAPTGLLRIDESFASRTTGDTEDATLRAQNKTITGYDLKVGILRSINLFDSDNSGWDNLGQVRPAVSRASFTWRSAITITDPSSFTGFRDIGTHNMSSRDDILARAWAPSGSVTNDIAHREWVVQRQRTHDLRGVIYMESARAAQLQLELSTGWTGFRNFDNGSFLGGGLNDYIHLFNSDGTISIPAPTANMNMYLLWVPRAVNIQVNWGGTNTSSWTSFHGDTRPGTSLVDPQLNPNDIPSGYMLSHWRAVFVYEAPNGNLIHRSATRILFPLEIDRLHTSNWLYYASNAGLHNGYPVTTIILTREIQPEDTLVAQVVDQVPFDPDTNPRYLFGVNHNTSSDRTIFTNVSAITAGQFITFAVDPFLRHVASAFHGQRVFAYQFMVNDAPHRIYVGGNIQITTTGPTTGHVIGDPSSVATINVTNFPFLALTPLVELVQFQVNLNWDTQSIAGAVGTGAQFLGTQTVQDLGIGLFNSTVNTAISSHETKFGYFVNRAAGISNVGFKTNNQVVPNLRFPASLLEVSLGLVRPSDAPNNIDTRRVEQDINGEYNILNLWIDWTPRQILGLHRAFIQDPLTGELATRPRVLEIPLGAFGQNIQVPTAQRLMDELGVSTYISGSGWHSNDIRRIGFNHTGWEIFTPDNFDELDFTNTHATVNLSSPILNTGGGISPNMVQNTWFGIRGDALELNLVSTFEGIAMPGIQIEIIDRRPVDPETGITSVRTQNIFDPNNDHFELGNSWSSYTHASLNGAQRIIHRNFRDPGTMRFGDRMPIDGRFDRFTHEEFTLLHGWQQTPNILYSWQYRRGPSGGETLVPANVVYDSGLNRSFIVLDDISAFNADRTSANFNQFIPAAAGAILLETIFDSPLFRLLEVEQEHGMQNGQRVHLSTVSSSDLRDENGVFTQRAEDFFEAIDYGSDFIIDNDKYDNFVTPSSRYVQSSGRAYTVFYTQAPVDLYETFIYDGDEIDNRFIRFGYELIGFRATTNQGIALVNNAGDWEYSETFTRDYLRNGFMFEHQYIATARNHSPVRVVLTPIWRAINVEFMVIDNLPSTDQVINFSLGATGQTPWNPTNNDGIGMVVNAPFESSVNLPLLRFANSITRYHNSFTWHTEQNFTGGPMGGIVWDHFENFHIGHSTVTGHITRNQWEDTVFNQTNIHNQGTPNPSVRIFLYPAFNHGNTTVFNFHLRHHSTENAPAPLLQAKSITHVLKPTMEFVAQGTGDVYTAEEYDNMSSIPGHWRYITEFRTESDREERVTLLRLPELSELSGITPAMVRGMRSHGWFLNQHDAVRNSAIGANSKIGETNDVIRFFTNSPNWVMNENIRVVDNAVNNLPSTVHNAGAGISHLFLLYDYVEGSVIFLHNGGAIIPPTRTGVLHNEIVNFTADMTHRTRYSLAGWEYIGHIAPGQSVGDAAPVIGFTPLGGTVISVSGNNVTVFNQNFPMTAQFPGGTDGRAIVLRAVWVITPVEVRFVNGISNNPITGTGFDNFTVQYNTPWYEHALPVPTMAGHTFVRWNFQPHVHGGVAVPTTSNSPNDLIIRNIVGGYTLVAQFAVNSYRIAFNLNADVTAQQPQTRPLGGETTNVTNNGFTFGSTVTDLIDILRNAVNAPVISDNVGRTFVGWAFTQEDAFVMDPRGTPINSRVMLGSVENRTDTTTTPSTHITNIQWASQLPTTTFSLNADGSRTYTITLFARYSDAEIHVNYLADASDTVDINNERQTGFMFAPGQVGIEIGGDNASTVGMGRAGMTTDQLLTWGMMVRSDRGLPHLAGHNFFGWLPVAQRLQTSTNTLGVFPTGSALARIFHPGEFLPTMTDNFDLVAVWVPHTAGAVNLANIPLTQNLVARLGGVTVSVPNSHTSQIRVWAPATTPSSQVTTNASHIILPRTLTSLGTEAIIANSATRIQFSHGPTPTTVAPRAVISETLSSVYMHDGINGGNIIAGTVSTNGRVISTNMQTYITTQGQVTPVFQMSGSAPTNVIQSVSFTGQSTNFVYVTDEARTGILYRHAGGGNRLLAAVPGARTLPAVGTLMANVTTIQSYAFTSATNIGAMNLTLAPAVFTTIEARAFYHTSISSMTMPTRTMTISPTFISGFNANFATFSGAAAANGLRVDSDSGFSRIFHIASGTVVYATAISGATVTIPAMNAQPYAFFRMTIPTTVTRFDVTGITQLAGVRGLYFEHFGVTLPNNIINMTLNGTNIQTLDWRLFTQLQLNNGMRLTGLANIINPSTGAASQPNRFGVLVDTMAIAASYRAQPGVGPAMMVNGNSRFIAVNGPGGNGMEIRYNRGVLGSPGVPSIIPAEIHTVNGLAFGQQHTFLNPMADSSPIAGFLHDGHVFTGWRVNLTAAQNTGLTAAQRTALGMPSGQTWFIIPAGGVRTIGMLFDANTIFIDGYITVIATWIEVLVSFVGREGLDAANQVGLFNMTIQIWNGTSWDVSNMYDPRLGVAGTQIRMPGANHSMVAFGYRTQLVGWIQSATPVNWRWYSTAPANRIFPDGSATFTLTSSITTFQGLYDFASSNVNYTIAATSVTATRNTTVAFDANNRISIPAAVYNSITGLMRPVTHIAENAFNHSIESHSIWIGENIQEIGTGAFQMVRSLALRFGANELPVATRNTLPALTIGTRAFAYNYTLPSVTIPSNVTTIGERAFLENFALATVTISEGTERLNTIGTSAFESARSLADFGVIGAASEHYIPRSVRAIGRFAFTLTDITTFRTTATMTTAVSQWHGVAGSRTIFVAEHGHLFERLETGSINRLVLYAPGQTSQSVNLDATAAAFNRVGADAFAHHRHVRSIFVPSRMNVENGAFGNMHRLENLYLQHNTPALFAVTGQNPLLGIPSGTHGTLISLVTSAGVGTGWANLYNLPATWTLNPSADLVIWRTSTIWNATTTPTVGRLYRGQFHGFPPVLGTVAFIAVDGNVGDIQLGATNPVFFATDQASRTFNWMEVFDELEQFMPWSMSFEMAWIADRNHGYVQSILWDWLPNSNFEIPITMEGDIFIFFRFW